MTLTSIDFSGADRKPMPAKVYVATLTDWEEIEPVVDEDENGNPKYPYVKLTFEAQYEDPDLDPDDDDGVRKLYRNLSESPKSKGYFKQALVALGAPPSSFNQVKGEGTDVATLLDGLVGNQCLLKVGVREWEGTLRNDISRIMPMTEGAAAAAGSSWK